MSSGSNPYLVVETDEPVLRPGTKVNARERLVYGVLAENIGQRMRMSEWADAANLSKYQFQTTLRGLQNKNLLEGLPDRE